MLHFVLESTKYKNSKILEIGCGYGRYLYSLAEMGYTNAYGIDISCEQINYAKNKLSLPNVEEADALIWLEGKEGEYDCILAIDILEHLPLNDLMDLGEKIHGALSPGGVAIFQVPNGVCPLNPIIYGDLTHQRAFTTLSMQQFLLNSGFKDYDFQDVPPLVHNFKSMLKKIIWMTGIKPVIGIISRCIHGNSFGGNIFSANFICYAKKSRE